MVKLSKLNPTQRFFLVRQTNKPFTAFFRPKMAYFKGLFLPQNCSNLEFLLLSSVYYGKSRKALSDLKSSLDLAINGPVMVILGLKYPILKIFAPK